MRTIKFRGYNEKRGVWLYGSHIINRGAHFVAPDEFANGKTWEDYEVIPESVGQFTGLHDKNGKKIFEGDVIKCGMRLYVCAFIEGGFEFRDLSDSKLILKAIVNNSCIIGNIHDNQQLLKGGKQ